MVHRGLISRCSEPLEAMMENGMQESQSGSAPLQDVDRATFGRFVEFVYTGDYNPARPVPLNESVDGSTHGDGAGGVESAAFDATEEVDDIGHSSSSRRRCKHGRPSRKACQKCKRLRFIQQPSNEAATASLDIQLETVELEWPEEPTEVHYLPSGTIAVVTSSPLPTNSMFGLDNDWSLDYLPVFMSHAQLYVFAEKYAVDTLVRLTARRLEEALSEFRCSASPSTSIVTLVKYIYETAPDHGDGEEVLWTIVTNFAANNLHALQRSDEFQDLLAEGGAFPGALFGKVCVRYPE